MMGYGSRIRRLGRWAAAVAGAQTDAVIVAGGIVCLAAPLALAVALLSPDASPVPKRVAACWHTSLPAAGFSRDDACGAPGHSTGVAMLLRHRSPRFMIIPGRFDGARGDARMHFHSAVQYVVIGAWTRGGGHRL